MTRIPLDLLVGLALLSALVLPAPALAQSGQCGPGRDCQVSSITPTRSSLPTCDATRRDQIRTDASDGELKRCDGSQWTAIGGGGGCGPGADCTVDTLTAESTDTPLRIPAGGKLCLSWSEGSCSSWIQTSGANIIWTVPSGGVLRGGALMLSQTSGFTGLSILNSGVIIDLGAGALDSLSSSGTGVRGSIRTSGAPIGVTPQGSPPTCEDITRGSWMVVEQGDPPKDEPCFCRLNDGDYAWVNLLTGAVGTTTTCPAS